MLWSWKWVYPPPLLVDDEGDTGPSCGHRSLSGRRTLLVMTACLLQVVVHPPTAGIATQRWRYRRSSVCPPLLLVILGVESASSSHVKFNVPAPTAPPFMMVALPALLLPRNSVKPAAPPLLRLVIWATPALLVSVKIVNPPVSLTMVGDEGCRRHCVAIQRCSVR